MLTKIKRFLVLVMAAFFVVVLVGCDNTAKDLQAALDKINIENGEVQDKDNIIASLKKAKPNFFGKFETVSDGYIKGETSKPLTALEKQKAGNTIGAINDYLKNILK